MNEQLLHQQQALRAGIQRSDARARQHSGEHALNVVRQYDLLLGFLQRVQHILDKYELNAFYFPIKSAELLCVYRIIEGSQPIPITLRPYDDEARLLAQRLFDLSLHRNFLSYEHPPLKTRTSLDAHSSDIVIYLILAVLSGYLPRPYPRETASLVICCPIPEEIITASSRFRELTGVLILFGEKQIYSNVNPDSIVDDVRKEFNSYVEETGRFAIRELEFFLSSLMNQEERLQDNQNRALGFIAHMVVHRFRNFRQAAQIIIDELSTVEKVNAHQQIYEDSIRGMQTQLHRAQRLEKQLEYIGRMSAKTRIAEVVSVAELIDIFKYALDERKQQTRSTALLNIEVPEDLRNEQMISPYSVLEEVFYNHIENMLREIDRPEVDNKQLTVRVRCDINYIFLDIINYGPPLSPDILEALHRTVRVRRPTGDHSGLGLFLSAMIMRHVGGDQEVLSPLQNSDRGVCVTLKFPRVF